MTVDVPLTITELFDVNPIPTGAELAAEVLDELTRHGLSALSDESNRKSKVEIDALRGGDAVGDGDGTTHVDVPGRDVVIGQQVVCDTVQAQDERDIIQGLWGVRVYDGKVFASDFETGTYSFEIDLD